MKPKLEMVFRNNLLMAYDARGCDGYGILYSVSGRRHVVFGDYMKSLVPGCIICFAICFYMCLQVYKHDERCRKL